MILKNNFAMQCDTAIIKETMIEIAKIKIDVGQQKTLWFFIIIRTNCFLCLTLSHLFNLKFYFCVYYFLFWYCSGSLVWNTILFSIIKLLRSFCFVSFANMICIRHDYVPFFFFCFNNCFSLLFNCFLICLFFLIFFFNYIYLFICVFNFLCCILFFSAMYFLFRCASHFFFYYNCCTKLYETWF